jgi:hypothetical protein
MTPLQREALEAVAKYGSIRAAAKALGRNKASIQERLDKIDPAILDSMKAVGTDMIPALAWAKVPAKDGEPGYSVLLKPQAEPVDIIARMVEAFSAIPSAPPVTPPERVQDDLCALWPLYDVHWGLHAWGKETGGDDYDLKLAESDLLGAFERVLAMTPFVGHAVLLIGGDFFHADDNTAQTPASRHQLDVDGRVFKTIDTAIRALSFIIQRIQSKAARVTVRVLRGNHDEHSHLYLTFALAERFRDASVTVEKDPRDLFMFRWGRTSIFGHHGDKMKPQDLVLRLADQCPFWSETRHRYAYTGHKHRLAAERIGGVMWEQLDAFCPPDAYGSTWTGRRAFKAEVFSKQSGRVLTAHDPLERTNNER